MQRLRHNESLLAAVGGYLIVGCPCVEDIIDVWQEIAAVISLGNVQNIKELAGYLRCGRNTTVCWASKDEKDVLTFFNLNLVV